MLKSFIFLSLPVLVFAMPVFSNDGKRIYQSITTTVKSSMNLVQSTMNTAQGMAILSESRVLTPEEREKFLKEQFTSKKELLNTEVVKKENLNIHDEALEFFRSLNKYSKKPIDIE